MIGKELIGQVVGGRYKIDRVIGRGGMGMIFEVSHQVLGRKFAMKTLSRHLIHDESAAARFFREADAIAKLRHPNVVDVFGWEHLDDGSPCIVMEFLHGEDLGHRIRKNGALPWSEILEVSEQVLSALGSAHAAGILHRDLKPPNIYLAADDTGAVTAKLLDFGLSKVLDDPNVQTTDARVMGTPSYMAPEQAHGKREEIGPHTDVWAMGAILHEMATGRLAYPGSMPLQILYRICKGDPESIAEHRPDAPKAFVELLGRVLCRDEARRMQSAEELREGLHEALASVADMPVPRQRRAAGSSPPMAEPLESVPRQSGMTTTDSAAFLLTEVVGAVQFWEDDPDGMTAAMARHDAIIHEAMLFHGGTVFKETGEGFCVAFPDVSKAAAAALAAQRMLDRADFGTLKDLPVRIAIHVGHAYQRGGSFYGPTLNRASRMLPLAKGRQIILSKACAEQVDGALPSEASLQDVGIHPLRDLTRPEHLYLLNHPDLRAEMPSRLNVETGKHNLPSDLSTFVGRRKEVSTVKERLAAHRLVSLVGLGGAGKTRVALEVARQVQTEFAEGVWFVELASLGEGELLAQTIGEALDVAREGMFSAAEPWQSRLVSHFSDREALLVLDTCEHIIDACAELCQELLKKCPGLRLLCVSRESLGIAGEVVEPLTPMQVSPVLSLEDAKASEVVALFVERARAAKPDFELTAQNYRDVAQICDALEGIPLAIELAAARVRILSVASVAQRLSDRFSLLSGGQRGADPRQKSLRATLDWSYEHLEPSEQTLLERLSVFRGSFSLGAAEAVCAGDGLKRGAILDGLAQLSQKSLIKPVQADGDSRYLVLDTVREYGREKLEERGDTRSYHAAQRDWCVELVERAEPGLKGPNQTAFLDELEAEFDNIRAAIKWAIDEDDGRDALRFCASLWWFWWVRGHMSEGRRLLPLALEADKTAPEPVRARALAGCGLLTVFSEPGVAKDLFEQGLELARGSDDRANVALACFGLGWHGAFTGDVENMIRWLSESRELFSDAGDTWGRGTVCTFLGGAVAAAQGREHGEPICQEAVTALEECGDQRGLAYAYLNYGELLRICDEHGTAVELYDKGLALCRDSGDLTGTVIALSNIGVSLTAVGEYLRAESSLRESLAVGEQLGFDAIVPVALLGLAGVDLARGRFERTARLLGASLGIQEAVGGHFHPADQAYYEALFMELRTKMDRDLMMQEIKVGETMDMEAARAFGQRGPAALA